VLQSILKSDSQLLFEISKKLSKAPERTKTPWGLAHKNYGCYKSSGSEAKQCSAKFCQERKKLFSKHEVVLALLKVFFVSWQEVDTVNFVCASTFCCFWNVRKSTKPIALKVSSFCFSFFFRQGHRVRRKKTLKKLVVCLLGSF